MPKRIQDFARQSLVDPIVVNVGRAGAANLDVVQEVEFVREEAKMVYLLECLQKTAPPTIIFSENKNEVDGKPSLLTTVRWPDKSVCRHTRVSSAQRCRSSRNPRKQEYVSFHEMHFQY